MTNLGKKIERLELLKHSVLESIHNYCTEVYYEGSKVTGEVEIWIGEKLLNAKIYVVANVLIEGHTGDFWNAPEKDEVDFELVSVQISPILNDNCVELPKVTAMLNYLLSEEEGKILNY